MACRSITSSQHTCLMVLLEGPGSGCFKWTVTYFVVTEEKSDVGLEASADVGNPKAWHRDCRKDQWDPPNSFSIPLIKRVSLPPSQLCHSGLAGDCFHIFFELLSFIFYHIFSGSFFYLQHLTCGFLLMFITLQCLVQNLSKLGTQQGWSIIFCCEYNKDCHTFAPEEWPSKYTHPLSIIIMKLEQPASHWENMSYERRIILFTFPRPKWHI